MLCRFRDDEQKSFLAGVWRRGDGEVLELHAVVVNGDLDDYMNYYKERYRDEHHLSRYDPATIEDLNLAA
jgi:hypothetical protein